MVNTCTSLAAISAPTSAGMEDWYLLADISIESTHSLMPSVSFFGPPLLVHTTLWVLLLELWYLAVGVSPIPVIVFLGRQKELTEVLWYYPSMTLWRVLPLHWSVHWILMGIPLRAALQCCCNCTLPWCFSSLDIHTVWSIASTPSGYGYWGDRMHNSLAAFHEMSAQDTPGKMRMSSLRIFPCRLMVTGIFPTCFMQAPLTAWELISDCARLFKWCPQMLTIVCWYISPWVWQYCHWCCSCKWHHLDTDCGCCFL